MCIDIPKNELYELLAETQFLPFIDLNLNKLITDGTMQFKPQWKYVKFDYS